MTYVIQRLRKTRNVGIKRTVETNGMSFMPVRFFTWQLSKKKKKKPNQTETALVVIGRLPTFPTLLQSMLHILYGLVMASQIYTKIPR